MFVPVDDVSADAVPVPAGHAGSVLPDHGEAPDVAALHAPVDALDDSTAQAWAEALRRRCEELGGGGIVYQTLVVPEAPVVHRDPVPEDLELVARTPFQRVVDALDDEIAEHCVYPLDDLVAGRERAETFAPAQTVWTDWGAWIGYRASITALATVVPGVRELDEGDVEWSTRPGVSSETAGAGGVDAVARVRSPRSRISMSLTTEDGDTYLVVEQDAPDLPTAVVFRDSCMDAAAKFFAESFRRTVFVSTPNVVHRDLVELEQPDVVIHELSESRLVVAPDEPAAPDFRTAFGDLLLDDAEARADQRRSRSLTRAGRLEEALAASDDVLAKAPPTARLLLHRARLHLGTGRVDAGLEALRHAATLDPDDDAVWALLGQVLARTPGHEAESVGALARAARTQPGDALSWQRAISAALRADDLRLAEELRREALTRHPDDPQLANAASWVLAATGRLEEAEEAAGYAARTQPDVVEHLWQLASIQIRRGRLDDASVTVAKLDRLRPEDPDVQHYRDVLGRAASAQTSTQGGNDEGQR
jgi:Flp pilus assembly protein TadD